MGPFASVSDLTRVHGIGLKTLERIEPICFVDMEI
jgi:DNA uptake protein ComE-like DNA-binding protein